MNNKLLKQKTLAELELSRLQKIKILLDQKIKDQENKIIKINAELLDQEPADDIAAGVQEHQD